MMFLLFFSYRKSASCTHVSALLHALVAMAPTQFPEASTSNVDPDEEEDVLPVTSYPCQWKPPRKRKESNLKMSEANFEKPVYGKNKKVTLCSLETFDPRPTECCGTAKAELSKFLAKVHGKGVGVSLLFDPSTRIEAEPNAPSESFEIPSSEQLQRTVKEFKSSLQVTEQKAREIERNTREQSSSSEWFSVRRYRLTASHFGEIFHQRPDTSPDALVKRLLNPSKITSPAIEWGLKHEPVAIQEYINHHQRNGNDGLTVCRVGFHINHTLSFLGASPDGGVYDPSSDQPYGFLEVKCPFSHRDHTPAEASASSGFYCTLDAENNVILRRSHNYYCQVQGQMAIGERPWCDFVVFTPHGISVERIKFDSSFWNPLLCKLEAFFDKCFAPEIISPMHVIGQCVRDLRK